MVGKKTYISKACLKSREIIKNKLIKEKHEDTQFYFFSKFELVKYLKNQQRYEV